MQWGKFGRGDESKLHYGVKAVLLAGAYVVTAKAGLALALTVSQVTTIWPATGVAMAALLLMGFGYWPAILVGAFVANFLTHEPFWVAALIALGNTGEALCGAYLLDRFLPGNQALLRIRNVFGLLLYTAILATLISSIIGTFSLWAGRLIGTAQILTVWKIWWVGDMMGALIIVPPALALADRGYRQLAARRPLEAGLVLALTFGLTMLVFARSSLDHQIPTSMPYILFPLIVWATMRLAQVGAAVAGMIIAITSTWATVLGLGPFVVTGSVEQNLLNLYCFMFVVMSTGLVLAAMVWQQIQLTWRHIELEVQLKDANARITNILAGILDEDSPRRHLH